MKQTFIVTIDAEDNITSKEVADCLNHETGVCSLNFNHDNDIILAKARKVNTENTQRYDKEHRKR